MLTLPIFVVLPNTVPDLSLSDLQTLSSHTSERYLDDGLVIIHNGSNISRNDFWAVRSQDKEDILIIISHDYVS